MHDSGRPIGRHLYPKNHVPLGQGLRSFKNPDSHHVSTPSSNPLQPLLTDSIHFGQRETHAQMAQRFKRKFGIDVNTITTVKALSPEAQEVANTLKPKEIKRIAIEALKAHDQAWKHSKVENLSGHYWGYSMQLQSGRWEVATNTEHARDCVYCGERSAITTLWNRELTHTLPQEFEDPDSLTAFKKTLQVKNMVMGDSDAVYLAQIEDGNRNPCSDCLHVMNTGHFFSPETRLFTLCRDETKTDQPDNGFYLGFRELKEFLPQMGKQHVSLSLTAQSLDRLPIQFSKSAEAFLNAKGNDKDPAWWTSQIRTLLKSAQAEYHQPGGASNPSSNFHSQGTLKNVKHLSESRVYVATLFNRGDYSQVTTRVDASKRWNTSAEESAEVLGVHQFSDSENQGELQMDLMAYYGDDPMKIPDLKSLGHIATLRGGPETLLAMIDSSKTGEQTIHVRTIKDYMPYLYL